MKTADGALHQRYNGQAIVDCTAQVIVAAELSDQPPDARLLETSLDQLGDNLTSIDAELPANAALLGDAGYFSEHNITITERHGLDPHLATGRFMHSEAPAPAPRERVPKDATPKQLMARKLAKKAGAALHAQRKTIVEPVFGQMDTVQDARQLRLRGKPAARAQWRFQCTIHNLPQAAPQRRPGPRARRMRAAGASVPHRSAAPPARQPAQQPRPTGAPRHQRPATDSDTGSWRRI